MATFWLIFSSMEDTFISAFLSSAVSLAISRPPELCLVASRSLALKIFYCFNKKYLHRLKIEDLLCELSLGLGLLI